MKFILPLIITSLCITSTAASFDCQKASTPTETAICNDAELSSQDESLASAYKKAEAKLEHDAPLLRTMEYEWIRQMATDCTTDVNCIRNAYQNRINLLTSIANPDKDGSTFSLGNISKNYDFILHMYEKCEPSSTEEYGTCEGPGKVMVRAKQNHAAIQTILMENIFLSVNKKKHPLTNSAQLYDYQGVINVGDFNFDGEEDFAIQNGNHGSYGGPSYDVYLYSPKTKKFEFSSALSTLIEESLGFFQIDSKRKRIITLAKAGCCYHVQTEYEITNNLPVEVESVTEDALQGKNLIVTTKKLVNGKWHTKVKQRPIPQ